jgi:hypothetical protein
MRAPADNARLRAVIVEQAKDVSRTCKWSAGRPQDPGAVLCRYVMERIPYVEDGRVQSIRRPWALIAGGLSGDCKSTAVFIGGMARSAGADVVIRFVQYADGPPWLSHVYAVVDGVACDPLQGYGAEMPYIAAEDHSLP